MRKKTFDRIKKTIAILLLVCFLVSITTAAVGAFSTRPTSGKAPLTVKFTDKSTGSPTSWIWSFGDGTYSTQKNPTHTYSKAGKYTVSFK